MRANTVYPYGRLALWPKFARGTTFNQRRAAIPARPTGNTGRNGPLRSLRPTKVEGHHASLQVKRGAALRAAPP
eukprot:6144933-Alexandrium_andersonii.AAC.1